MDESQLNTAGAADLGFELKEFGRFESACQEAHKGHLLWLLL